jgi:integrase
VDSVDKLRRVNNSETIERWPAVSRHPMAAARRNFQVQLRLATRTIDAYGRAWADTTLQETAVVPSTSSGINFWKQPKPEPLRNRLMLAFAYNAGLRREELCSVRTDDLDP